MKISYAWIQEYFDEKLPLARELAELVTKRSYEVESAEEKNGDFIFEIDVLPNRAHDSLCHRGVAKEIATILNLKLKTKNYQVPTEFQKTETSLNIKIQEPELCRRYVGRVVEGVKVGPSPAWLKERLAAIGQRSINNIVDATNFIMWDMGQPLHAFDAEKLAREGDTVEIIVRKSGDREKMTTLDGKDVTLDGTELLIADREGPLALAGIKGGGKAEVDMRTKTVVLEAANFHPTETRKTSRKHGILTDSSKRFENEITPEFAEIAIEKITRLIMEVAGSEETKIGDVVDIYPKRAPDRPKISVSLKEINMKLGVKLSEKEVEDILLRFGWKHKMMRKKDAVQYEITPPTERLDTNIGEDVIEEVGRVYGYENIVPTPLPEMGFIPKVNKEFYYANRIRNILITEGFSEVQTSSFRAAGGEDAMETLNPIAADKQYLRQDLALGIGRAVELGLRNADLLGKEHIKVFEIGTVFGKKEGEHTKLCLALASTKKKYDGKAEMNRVLEVLREALGGRDLNVQMSEKEAVVNLTDLLKTLSEPLLYEDVLQTVQIDKKYDPISQYPYIVRDIALFVPEGVSVGEIEEFLEENSGELLARPPKLFDQFHKAGSDKISYAFRLVFQSHEKTLTDDEVNVILQRLAELLNSKDGWKVR